jgi:TPR repeat protein
MAVPISQSPPSGDRPVVSLSGPIDAQRSQSAAVEAPSRFFLTAIGVVAAASAGSLYAAAYVLLMQPKAAVGPPAPSAVRAEAAPTQIPPAGVAANAPLPLVQQPAPAPPAAASPRDAAPPAPARIAAKATSPLIERTAPTPAAAGLPGVAVTPPQGTDPRSIAERIALAEGDANFGAGKVSVARFYYEQAVDGGDAAAAVRMGETFDPAFLTEGRLRRVRGNPAAARFWYDRALGLGAAEAQQRLDYLDEEPAAGTRASGEARSNMFRARRADQPASPPNVTLQQLLERILHPSRGN